MFTVSILVMEDEVDLQERFRMSFPVLASRGHALFRQELLAEFLEVDFEVKVAFVSTPSLVRETLLEGASFDVVVSDGTGWLEAAKFVASRFPVIGYTGSREDMQSFEEMGIIAFLKSANNVGKRRTCLGVCAEALKFALRRRATRS